MSKPKILEQIDNAGGVFIATYGTTTYQEVKDAYDSGKDVVCYYQSEIYDLCTVPSGGDQLYFYNREWSAQNGGYATTYYKCLLLTLANSWVGPSTNKYTIVSSDIRKSSQTPISSSTGYYRPIRLSTAEPTSSDGYVGDVWIQYEE